MASDRRKSGTFDSKILSALGDQLACPVCRGELRVEDARLICTACGLAYPIVDGIPVLIGERAEGPRSE